MSQWEYGDVIAFGLPDSAIEFCVVLLHEGPKLAVHHLNTVRGSWGTRTYRNIGDEPCWHRVTGSQEAEIRKSHALWRLGE
jgi:hypothetical protein